MYYQCFLLLRLNLYHHVCLTAGEAVLPPRFPALGRRVLGDAGRERGAGPPARAAAPAARARARRGVPAAGRVPAGRRRRLGRRRVGARQGQAEAETLHFQMKLTAGTHCTRTCLCADYEIIQKHNIQLTLAFR